MASYLTQEDVQNFGHELVDFSQRAAVHAVAPHLQELERQNADLHARLARATKLNLELALDRAVPNWREIDRNPRWLHWLAGRDVGVRYFGASTQNICSAATRLQRGELWAAERSATCTHRAGVS